MSKANEAKQTPTPTETTKLAEVKREIAPVLPSDFGLETHRIRRFDALIPPGATQEDLTKPSMWAHVANQLVQYSEVRALAEDGAYVANLIVTFKSGIDVIMAVTNFTALEKISYETADSYATFEVKQRGVRKWCVMDKRNGKPVIENIATQSLAFRALEEHLAILAR